MKRYWLMKLIDFDVATNTQTWKCLKMGSEEPQELNNFLGNGYRIFDNQNRIVIETNLDLEKWLEENEKSQK